MIDLSGTGLTTALSPPVPAERRDEGGPAFAILLAQASVTPEATPVPMPMSMPVPETAAVDGAEPTPVAERHDVPVRRAVVDHAIRFDARGMIAMAAEAESVLSDVPVIAPPGSTGTDVTAPPPVLAPDMVPQPVTGTVHALPAVAAAAPADRTPVGKPHALPVAATPTALGEAAPARPLPDEPEIATAPPARPRTRFAAMAQGAPKVAVVALTDGLAVSAAVGALSEGERHRMRDAIAATLSRHGLRPRAVTLLAMPAPTTRTER